MKKQIKFKNYLVSSLFTFLFIFFFLVLKPVNIQSNNVFYYFTEQDTIKDIQYKQKMLQQSKKIEQINQQVDSVQLKWDLIEKKLREQKEIKDN